jgi:prepilin-type N-terminal cleavage/methylation domain-containing protein
VKSRHNGFTLVEVAIVIVILGLLLAGVIKGQEIILQRKTQATFQLARELSAAINAYMDRYGQLPGDDPHAAARFPGAVPRPVNGNGDGVISYGNCGSGFSTAEGCQALYEMRLAGLLPGSGASSVRSPLGGQADIGPAGTFFPDGGKGPVLVFYPGTLTMMNASAIDSTFDDGNPATGSFRCQAVTRYSLASPDAPMNQFCMSSLP